jgi:ketosteroid isomerase-like protein
MTASITAELVRKFFAARLTRDPAIIGPLLHDDIEWSISGPIDVLRYAGHRRGKEAVLNGLVAWAPDMFKPGEVIIEDIVVEGDNAITRTRVTGAVPSSGRAISYQCAQLFRFRDGKIVQFRAIIDSFDAAEQVLGRAIDISDAPLNAKPAITLPAV